MKQRIKVIIIGTIILSLCILSGCTSSGNKTLDNGNIRVSYYSYSGYQHSTQVSIIFYKSGNYIVLIDYDNGEYLVNENITITSVPHTYESRYTASVSKAIITVNGESCTFY